MTKKNVAVTGNLPTVVGMVVFAILGFGVYQSGLFGGSNYTGGNAEKCIIVVDGSSYNVTEYRYIHEGGDTFKCGTDMSTEFHQQHPQKFLNKMKKYKI